MQTKEIKLNSSIVYNFCRHFTKYFGENKLDIHYPNDEILEATAFYQKESSALLSLLDDNPIEHINFDITYKWMFSLPMHESLYGFYKFLLVMDDYFMYLDRCNYMDIDVDYKATREKSMATIKQFINAMTKDEVKQ